MFLMPPFQFIAEQIFTHTQTHTHLKLFFEKGNFGNIKNYYEIDVIAPICLHCSTNVYTMYTLYIDVFEKG